MVIIKLMGGLGNQMFQYAFGRFLSIKTQSQLKLDLTSLKDRTPRPNFTFRDYQLDILNIKADFIPLEESRVFHLPDNIPQKFLKIIALKRQRKHYILEKLIKLYPNLCCLKGDIYFDGYWQNESYFKSIADIIRQDFTFRTGVDNNSTNILTEILTEESVCLHVRRTDYIANDYLKNFHGVCGIDYYQRAVDIITSRIRRPLFFIFSDDPQWCKDNIHINQYPFKIIGHEYDGEKYQNKFKLMTQCKHFIIANSTFSWWAAWLSNNPAKIIVAPKQWFKNPQNSNRKIVPESWIKT